MEDVRNDQTVVNDSVQPLGFGGRLVNIFTNPAKAFEAINVAPSWILPLALIVIITAIYTLMTFPMAMEAQMESFRNNPNITPEQLSAIENQVAQQGDTQKWISLGAIFVVMPIVYVIITAIFYLVGSVFLGGDTTFKKLLSAFTWASMIGILGIIVKLPLVFAKNNAKISLSPALIMPADSMDGMFYKILSNLDFFSIWYLAVFAIGFSALYKFSRTKSYITVFALWALWIVVSTVAGGFLQQFGIA
jgi:hypothetical protein